MKLKRAYMDIGGGYAVEAPQVVKENGETVEMAVSPSRKGKPVSVSEVKRKGLPIINLEQKNAEMQKNQPSTLPVGVGLSETPQGRVQSFRDETPGDPGGRKVFRIKISNAESNEESVVIGDPTGEIKRKLNISAPKTGVTFSGMYGSDTYSQLQKIVGLVPMDLHKIKFQGTTTAGAESTGFFDSGRFGLARFDIAGNTVINEELVISDLVQPSTFQTNIRKDDAFRFQLQAVTGFVVTIPAGEEVLITCTISAAGFTRQMDKV